MQTCSGVKELSYIQNLLFLQIFHDSISSPILFQEPYFIATQYTACHQPEIYLRGTAKWFKRKLKYTRVGRG